MKGIILAGGAGTRLYPLTQVTSKQLLAVYDKPMIYYPLSVLMMAGIRDILIISTPFDLPNFERLLGDGRNLGISLCYKEQPSPDGLAQAFIIGEEFIDGGNCAMILGDNIFYGNDFINLLRRAAEKPRGATVFCCYVDDPGRFGVISFDEAGKVSEINEKPILSKSNYAIAGLYFYDGRCVEYAKSLKPGERGELEITDLNNIYLKNEALDVIMLGRGFTWIDVGTVDSLADASAFIMSVEKRQGVKISAVEEVAYRMGFIDKERLATLAEGYGNSPYGEYLMAIVSGRIK